MSGQHPLARRGPRRAAARVALPLLAAGLVAGGLPTTVAGPAGAAEDGSDAPAFSGYSTSAWAAPVHLQIYEPTIPIPATPQLELMLGYSKVEADSGSSLGRASWLWPGDPVGEGLKTFVEQLGLPPQLGENGYPIQVNSSSPTGEPSQADEPIPGMVMRTSASPEHTIAETGFSLDGQLQDPAPGGAGSGDSGDEDGGDGVPSIPGLPEIPGLEGLPGLPGLGGLAALGGGQEGREGDGQATDLLTQFGQAITGGSTAAAGEGEDEGEEPEEAPGGGSVPGLPPELAGLIDFAGYVSTTESKLSPGEVRTVSRSALGEVSLLGGLVTLQGIAAKAVASSDGAKGKPAGRAVYGSLSIAGQEFAIGSDGLVAAGSPAPIPGLPDDPAAALGQLGISISTPAPTLKRDGDKAVSRVGGIVVDLDLAVLKGHLKALPLQQILDQIPAEAGELKTLLQTVVGLAPRVVVTLGAATSTVDTVQGLDMPDDVPDNDPNGEPVDDADGSAAGDGGAVGGTGGVASGDVPPADAGAGAAGDGADGDLTDAAPMGAGLPPLFSIPGFLLFAGIAAATVAGSWLRRIGALALGGGAACPHGLDCGLPDLRKA
ncbi:choice-of-anchor P family protein [Nocardioides ferulae]|uniref:choice-of-anchor P family protein n=1 Tax=Nocardioides ferulae TaxID=2340821 RepID=UPI000EAD762D|nr:choice-of-anchor P family protein [Nocardioides ferulae]